jgi:hypothetical protein
LDISLKEDGQSWRGGGGGPHNSLRNRRRAAGVYTYRRERRIEFTSAPLFINNNVTLNVRLNTLVNFYQIKIEDQRCRKELRMQIEYIMHFYFY